MPPAPGVTRGDLHPRAGVGHSVPSQRATRIRLREVPPRPPRARTITAPANPAPIAADPQSKPSETDISSDVTSRETLLAARWQGAPW